MKRLVYAFDTTESARAAIDELRGFGVDDNCISLIARSDIEMQTIPGQYRDVSTDFAPAMGRGAAIGSATGLVAGFAAMAFPPLGIAVGGAALIGFLAGGAIVGAWSAALVGASVPDRVRLKFEDEIAAGRILLVIDSGRDRAVAITHAMADGTNPHLLWQSDLGAPPLV
jgi:hypothetical protein